MIDEYLSFSKVSKKLLATLIDRIEIDCELNINVYYKIKNISSD